MKRILLVGAGLGVLIFSGVVHGIWTDRWADRSDLVAAANQLPMLPLALGDWQGEDLPQTTDLASNLAATLSRRYTHRSTGKVVSLYIGCGRPGPASVHTPEVCYAGSGYEVSGQTTFALPAMPGVPRGEFWTARFLKEKSDGRTQLRIFWSWHASGQWKIADDPRWSFANERLLYKLYVIRDLSSADDPIDTDPCVEFMRQLLPALEAKCI